MDPQELRCLMEAYTEVYAPQEVDEAKQSFPFKKVEGKMEKARKGSVYGKDGGSNSVPTDSEKKETSRFSKMFHASEKAKREKQNAAKASRSSTFYRDTHPASPAKMKKANEEFDVFDVVLEFLQAEGFAETLEDAEFIMANDLNSEVIDAILEARKSYSATAAREGKDIGKRGKVFGKIARDAGKRYGSEERGKKVAGAILAKLRTKHG
jgi:hypothetical protein